MKPYKSLFSEQTFYNKDVIINPKTLSNALSLFEIDNYSGSAHSGLFPHNLPGCKGSIAINEKVPEEIVFFKMSNYIHGQILQIENYGITKDFFVFIDGATLKFYFYSLPSLVSTDKSVVSSYLNNYPKGSFVSKIEIHFFHASEFKLLENYKSLFSEFTVAEIVNQLSPVIKRTYGDRKRKKGAGGRASQLADFDIKTGTAKFLVEPTNSFSTKVADLNGNLRAASAYEADIQFVDFDKWVDDWKTITLDEWKDILTVADVKLHCNCGSFHWTGIRYQWSELDSAIHPINIPDPHWRKIHTDSGVPTLCKHLEEVIKKIRRYPAQIRNEIIKKAK